MATELASAYLTLIPSLSGAQKKIEAQLSGVDVSKSGKRMGSSLSSGIGGGLKALGKIGVGAVASIGAAVAGLAVGGGVSRALKLDQARFKFKALEMDVESTMASCNEAVRGTAFGLDAAATVATQLGAAGVGAGDSMTGALKSVAGVAAMSSSSMEDIGAIFSKVAAKGKVGGDELLQLTERGINATAALAKYLGKTSEEVTQMVSKGKIDFATFSAAMEATFGEAASGANATFQGAMSNVMAALSRVGAKFASPALDGLRQVFVAAIPAIDAVSAALEPVVDRFSSVVGAISGKAVSVIEAFAAAVRDGGGAASAFGAAFRTLAEGTRFSALADAMTDPFLTWRGKVFKASGEARELVSGAVGKLVQKSNLALAKLGVNVPAIADGLRSLGDAAVKGLSSAGIGLPPLDGISAFVETVRGKARGVAEAVSGALSSLGNKNDVAGWFEQAAGSVEAVASKVGEAAAKVSELAGRFNPVGVAIAAVFSGVAAAIAPFVSTVVGAFAKIGGLSGIVAGLSGAFSPLVNAFKALSFAATPLGGGLGGVLGVLGSMMSPVGLIVGAIAALAGGFVYLMATSEGFRGVVGGLVGQIGEGLAPILAIVGQAVANLASTVLPLVSSMIAMLVPVIGQIAVVILQVVAALAPVVTMIVATVVPVLTEIIQLVVMVAAQILAAALPAISAVLLAIQTAMPTIQAIISAVMSVVLGIVAAAWPTIQGIIEAAMGVIRAVIDNVWPVVQGIIETTMAVIQDVISVVGAAISGDWEGVWNGVMQLFRDIWEGITRAASDGVNAVMNIVTGIKDSILGFFAGAGSWLCDAGSAIVQGLIDGITGMIGAAGDAIGSVMSAVAGFLPHSPAKKGAFSGRGWSLYSGQAITEALAVGISDRASAAVAAMSGVMSGVSGSMAARWDLDVAPQAYDAAVLPAASRQELGALPRSERGVTNYNVHIDGARVNDDEAIESAFFDLLVELKRKGMM